jgi:hypothetical protein
VSEVGHEAVAATSLDQALTQFVELFERSGPEGEMVQASPAEDRRLSPRLVVAVDLEHVDLRLRCDPQHDHLDAVVRQPSLDLGAEHVLVERDEPSEVGGDHRHVVETC